MPDHVQAKALTAVTGFVLNEHNPAAGKSVDLSPVDGFLVDGLLTAAECARLVQAAEQSGGFAFWDPIGGEKRRSVRNADTLEFEDPSFCEALWNRLAPLVPQRVRFGEENEERELAGEWAATGLNPHLLINRYSAGGHFAPHADGSTLLDFNHRSLYVCLQGSNFPKQWLSWDVASWQWVVSCFF